MQKWIIPLVLASGSTSLPLLHEARQSNRATTSERGHQSRQQLHSRSVLFAASSLACACATAWYKRRPVPVTRPSTIAMGVKSKSAVLLVPSVE